MRQGASAATEATTGRWRAGSIGLARWMAVTGLAALSACGGDDAVVKPADGSVSGGDGGGDSAQLSDSADTTALDSGAGDTTAADSEAPDSSGSDAAPADGSDGQDGDGGDGGGVDGGCLSSADCAQQLGALGACKTAICEASTGKCLIALANEAGACDDGDACTSADACKAGTCAGSAKVCDDGNPCTQDVCDSATGSCGKSPVDLCACKTDADCASADDGDLCNGIMRCDSSGAQAKCVPKAGSAVVCDTSGDTACLTMVCQPQAGVCAPVAAAAGKGCDDGSVCSEGDACAGGFCKGGSAKACDDGNACTVDSCDPKAGCQHQPNALPCDDGSACSKGDTCAGGACKGAAVACDDGNPCTDDICDAAKGCVALPNAATCSDGSGCTGGDACGGGACVPGKDTCACNVDGDCAAFDDGDACNGVLACDKTKLPYVCKIKAGSLVTCDKSGDTACLQTACDAKSGVCLKQPAATGAPCQDGNACTSNDACSGGACVGSGVPNCNDGKACTADACDPKTGCTNAPQQGACSDNNACTVNDFCDGGACTSGPPLACNDGNPCTKDACDAAVGCSAAASAGPCSDANACTAGDACDGGACKPGKAVPCDDKNPCTADVCAPEFGCQFAASAGGCEDGNACTAPDACSNGVCLAGANLNCSDDNPCSDDSCAPGDFVKPCKNIANSKGCSDDDPCTIGDGCQGGACVSGTKADCQDNNPCTLDGCDAKTGCVHLPSSATCTDGNPCTTGEACASGQCKGGGATNCDDGNGCTFDACAIDKGCTHAHHTNPCDDGDACSANDACKEGACKGGAPVPFCCNSDDQCNDGIACTKEQCKGHVCSYDAGGSAFASEGFEGAIDGWSLVSSNPKVTWQVVKDSGAEGKASLYAGNLAAGNYNFGETVALATMPPVQLGTGTVRLTFHVWMDTEDNDCEYDVLDIRVDNVTIDTICPSSKGWKPVTVDLSPFQGRKIKIAFAFDTIDELKNNGKGVWIDNVRVESVACAGGPCKSHKDCADFNACSGDLCVEGTCQHAPQPTHSIDWQAFDTTALGAAPFGWTLTTTSPKGKWQISDKKARSGKHSLWAGDAVSGGYDVGAAWKATAKLPAVRIPTNGATTLVFFTSRDVGDAASGDCAKDRVRVYAGSANKVMATRCGSTSGWEQWSVDLSEFASFDIQVTIEFDTVDAASNGGLGVFLDDVTVFHTRQCDEMLEPFEGNYAFNFTVTSNNPSVWWHVDTTKKYSGIRSFQAANPASKHANYGAVTTVATTGFPVCPGGELQMRLQTNFQDTDCAKDRLEVRVGDELVAKRCGSQATFELFKVDVSAWGGLSVPVTWTMVLDGANNNGQGAFLDDVWLICP